MTRSDFLNLVRDAKTEQGDFDQSASLEGIALHKDRRMVSRPGALGFINWQCRLFGGGWDTEELERTARYFRRVDLIN
jgi:hypothetical protein